MKKIIVHIGTPKTGSTSLQHFFNFKDFLLTNASYPDTSYLGRKNGSFLLLPPTSDLFINSIAKIKAELTKKDLVILSEEILSFHFVYNDVPYHFNDEFLIPASIKENFKYLINLFPNVEFEFLIYLRRQDTYIESEFKETLKGYGFNLNNENISFNELYKKYILTKEKMLNYDKWIKDLIDVVGEKRVRIKSFDNCIKNGLVRDFVKTYNLEVPDEIIKKNDIVANKGFSFVYLYVFNKLINKSSIELIRNYVFKYSYLDTYPNYRLLSEKETSNLISKYIKGNTLLENSKCYKEKNVHIFNYEVKNRLPIFDENSKEINDLLIKLVKEVTLNELKTNISTNESKVKKFKWKIKNKIKKIFRIKH